MTYVTIRDGKITGPELGGLPATAPRLDGGGTITPPDRAWTPDLLTACGLTEVAPVARPADTAATTYDRSITLVAGVPTETWTARAATTAETTARTLTSTEQGILSDIKAAVPTITGIRDAAQGDIANANTRKAGADTVSAQCATQSTQIAAWTPKATYTASDLTAIRDQIKTLTDRQKAIADAMAEMYAWRAATDASTVTIHNALLWLARIIGRRILN